MRPGTSPGLGRAAGGLGCGTAGEALTAGALPRAPVPFLPLAAAPSMITFRRSPIFAPPCPAAARGGPPELSAGACPITHAAHSHHDLRMLRILLDLGAQP